ncbi:MAG: triose-phosphate isomerase [Thermoanaerobaculia bacterium]|nr:triose-phosphate isomerase [Thermoanaerobaculia bacterium]
MAGLRAPRRPIFAANWKMNLLRDEAESFCNDLRGALGSPEADVVIFPAAPLLDSVARSIEGLSVMVGGQDVHHESEGAFTGDVSAPQLLDAGCVWALCGHSERRRDHAETDSLVGAKARAALDHGLLPMICLGETQSQRKAGETMDTLSRQLHAVLDAIESSLDEEGEPRFALAYEPVWAIGTGATATPALAQEAHDFLRTRLAERLGTRRASQVRILYGGSAKPGNVAELIAEPDIDGFLVGGASLDSVSFRAIIHNSAAAG